MTARHLTEAEIGAILSQRRAEAMAQLPRCVGCMDQGDYDCCRVERPAPAEAATEVGHSDGAPLTRAESLRFWLVVSAPAFVGVVGFAALLWVLKP